MTELYRYCTIFCLPGWFSSNTKQTVPFFESLVGYWTDDSFLDSIHGFIFHPRFHTTQYTQTASNRRHRAILLPSQISQLLATPQSQQPRTYKELRIRIFRSSVRGQTGECQWIMCEIDGKNRCANGEVIDVEKIVRCYFKMEHSTYLLKYIMHLIHMKK